jgi:hypothetical protein
MTNVPLQRTIEILGMRRSTYPGSIVMKLGLLAGFKIKSIHKGSKKLLYSGSIRALKEYGHIWKDGDGKVVARSWGLKGTAKKTGFANFEDGGQ